MGNGLGYSSVIGCLTGLLGRGKVVVGFSCAKAMVVDLLTTPLQGKLFQDFG